MPKIRMAAARRQTSPRPPPTPTARRPKAPIPAAAPAAGSATSGDPHPAVRPGSDGGESGHRTGNGRQHTGRNVGARKNSS
jgi:hypothetical protein